MEGRSLEVGRATCAFFIRELNQVAEALADHGVLIHGDTHPVFHYNLACYHSLLGNFKPAQICLNLACEKDASFKLEAKINPDLGPLWVHLATECG